MPNTEALPQAREPDPSTAWRWFNPSLLLAWVLLLTVLAWSVVPGSFTSYDPLEPSITERLRPPSTEHLLGTDGVGRDLLSRIVHGARQSVVGAALAVLVGLGLGTALGLVAGAAGGWLDELIMRLVDVLLSIPSLLLTLSIVTVLGFGVVNAAIAIGIGAVASFARLVRSEVVSVNRSEYVEAAFGSGGSFLAVLLRHVLPNSLNPVLALAALQFGSAVLAISTLGFLGYGAPPPTPEWGMLIAEGRNHIVRGWWLTTFPGIVVVLVVLSANRIALELGRNRP